jgi:predicted SnoaL-like aldol condensation-catalyzing enzyme
MKILALSACNSRTSINPAVERTMNALSRVMLAIALLAAPIGAAAQSAPQPPTTSQEQGLNFRNTVPQDFETIIIAPTEADRARAEQILEIYDILETAPTPENLRPYISDSYIQHNTLIPDGYIPLAMMFSASVAEYPVEIDVHKVMVSGDWAFAHVNFRNLSNNDPDDLGTAAVDIYLYDADGMVAEHWDVLQGVPTHSGNPNGMFLKMFEGE